MSDAPVTLDLPTPEATAALAARLAPALIPGDVLLLEGSIGAGKTHFARSLIQTRLAADGAPVEDVPSPTFTLVQTYDTGAFEIWHADLYRLTMVDEIEELGLIDAFETSVALVEWPDRLGDPAPATAMRLRFETVGEARRLTLTGLPPRMAALIETTDG